MIDWGGAGWAERRSLLEGFLSRPNQEAQPLQSPMTMAELVEKLFIPEQ